jgi:hypothetical protein
MHELSNDEGRANRPPIMTRYFFGLQGGQNTDDEHGLQYAGPLEAFRAAERLAQELSELRPHLRGNTWVVLTRRGADDAYYISVGRKSSPSEPAKRRPRM